MALDADGWGSCGAAFRTVPRLRVFWMAAVCSLLLSARDRFLPDLPFRSGMAGVGCCIPPNLSQKCPLKMPSSGTNMELHTPHCNVYTAWMSAAFGPLACWARLDCTIHLPSIQGPHRFVTPLEYMCRMEFRHAATGCFWYLSCLYGFWVAFYLTIFLPSFPNPMESCQFRYDSENP